MFHQKHHYHTHGMFFLLSLIVAFLLGRKSERYGLTIVSRGCGCYEDDDDDLNMMNNSPSTSDYPQ